LKIIIKVVQNESRLILWVLVASEQFASVVEELGSLLDVTIPVEDVEEAESGDSDGRKSGSV
jgi:hypothetical protein